MLVLPGAQIRSRPSARREEGARFHQHASWSDNKVVGAICHAPWLLVETDIVKGRRVTSYKSIKTDVINAGGKWEDTRSSPTKASSPADIPGDLDAFPPKLVGEITEGRHQRRAA